MVTGRIAGVNVCKSLGVVSKQEAEIETMSLWKELKMIETKHCPDVWEARIRHVEKYEQPDLKDQFIS
jgi:hypothetical protein